MKKMNLLTIFLCFLLVVSISINIGNVVDNSKRINNENNRIDDRRDAFMANVHYSLEAAIRDLDIFVNGYMNLPPKSQIALDMASCELMKNSALLTQAPDGLGIDSAYYYMEHIALTLTDYLNDFGPFSLPGNRPPVLLSPIFEDGTVSDNEFKFVTTLLDDLRKLDEAIYPINPLATQNELASLKTYYGSDEEYKNGYNDFFSLWWWGSYNGSEQLRDDSPFLLLDWRFSTEDDFDE